MPSGRVGVRVALAGAICSAWLGCAPSEPAKFDWGQTRPTPLPADVTPAPPRQHVPHPIDLLLPKEISIGSFTGTRTFDAAGGVRGIDVRVHAKDHYGTVTKAFGVFRFELYAFRPNNPNPKGALLNRWRVDLSDPKVNVRHWEDIPPCYKFRLKWSHAIPVGHQFVLITVFTSPFTERIIDERPFVAGE